MLGKFRMLAFARGDHGGHLLLYLVNRASHSSYNDYNNCNNDGGSSDTSDDDTSELALVHRRRRYVERGILCIS